MPKREPKTIYLFIASGAETKPIREKIVSGMQKLSRQNENSGFNFEVLRWEDESTAFPASELPQDRFNKLIDQSHMVAVIIQNTLGKYTKKEYNYAFELSKKTGTLPSIATYVFNSNKTNAAREKFVSSLKKKGRPPTIVKNVEELLLFIMLAMLAIKNEYEKSIQEVETTIERVDFDSNLTKEAVELFRAGKNDDAIKSLDMDLIREREKKASMEMELNRERDKELSVIKNENAKAFVLRAKLGLTDIRNKDRFAEAESYFAEALSASRDPEILFEYARYCQTQNNFEVAERHYEEALKFYRALAAVNPDTYNSDVAMTLNNLGILHSDTNKYEKAEKEYEEALQLHRELAAVNPDAYTSDVATTLNNLGNLHWNTNKHEQAEEEYKEALQIRRELAEANHNAYNADVATTLNTWASCTGTLTSMIWRKRNMKRH